MPHTLVLLRHGESDWNKENRFTGWTDVGLSKEGKEEAIAAGKRLKNDGYQFDKVYTSVLRRAIGTTWTVLGEMEEEYVPLQMDWRLNERHYGALQGLNKAETAAKHGDEQIKIWRRSYDVPPPALTENDDRFPGKDKRYAGLKKEELPLTESLKETVARVLPLWHAEIAPAISSGKKILISAHGNSLRALVKHIDGVSEKDITELNIPTAVPLVYEFDDQMKPIKHYYLMDEAALKAKTDAVANQGKAKAQ